MKKTLLITIFLFSGITKSMEIKQAAQSKAVAFNGIDLNKAIKVKYKNYRGEIGIRFIIPMEIYWGQTNYHLHDQWLVKVWDIDKNAERIYAFKDIESFDCK